MVVDVFSPGQQCTNGACLSPQLLVNQMPKCTLGVFGHSINPNHSMPPIVSEGMKLFVLLL